MPIKVRVDSDSLAARRDLDALKAAVERIKSAANNFKFSPFSTSDKNGIKKSEEQLSRLNTAVGKSENALSSLKGKAADAVRPLSGAASQSTVAIASINKVARAQEGVTGAIDKSTESSNRLLDNNTRITGQLKSAAYSFGALIAATAGITSSIALADTITTINTRIKLATKTQVEFNKALRDSQQIAVKTRVGISEISELYSKISRYTNNFSRSQREVARVTETVAKAITISGASAEVANGVVLQLGQGLSSGTLQGEELRAILEGAPELARAIAQGLGKSIGQLKIMGAEGRLLSKDVFGALLAQSGAIDDKFKKAGITFRQAFGNLGTSIIVLADNLNRAFGSLTGKALPEYINDAALGIAKFADNIEYLVLRTKLAISSAIAGIYDIVGEPLDIQVRFKNFKIPDIFPSMDSMTGFFKIVFDKVKEFASGVFDFSKVLKLPSNKELSSNFNISSREVDMTARTIGEFKNQLFSFQGLVSEVGVLAAGLIPLLFLPAKFATAIKAGFIAGGIGVVGKFIYALQGDASAPTSKDIQRSDPLLQGFVALSNSVKLYFASLPGVFTGALSFLFNTIKLPGIGSLVIGIGVLSARIIALTGLMSAAFFGFIGLADKLFRGASDRSAEASKSYSASNLADSLVASKSLGFLEIISIGIGKSVELVTKLYKYISSGIRNLLGGIKVNTGGLSSTLADSGKSPIDQIVETFKSMTGLGPYTGGGPQRNQKNRALGHDTLNTFIPIKAQIPVLAGLAGLVGAAVVAFTSSGSIRSILLSLTTTALGLAIGTSVYDSEIKRFNGVLVSSFVEIVHKVTTALFGSGIFGDKGFGGTLALIAKLSLLFASGREFVSKAVIGAATAPTNIANSLATSYQSKVAEKAAIASSKELLKVTNALQELKDDQLSAIKALANARLGNGQVGTAAARQITRDRLTPVDPSLTALANTARIAAARLEYFTATQGANITAMTKSTEGLKKHAEALKERVSETTKNVKTGFVNTAAGIGGIFGSLAGFNIGSQIAEGIQGATDWQKIGITLGSALLGQAILAGVGSALASAFITVATTSIGILGTAIAATFGSGLFLFAAGAAAIIAAVLNWSALKPILDNFVETLRKLWITDIIPQWNIATASLLKWLDKFSVVVADILNSKPFGGSGVPDAIKNLDTGDAVTVAGSATAAALLAKWLGYFKPITNFFANFSSSTASWRSTLVGISLQFDLMLAQLKSSFPIVTGIAESIANFVSGLFASLRAAIASMNIGSLLRGSIFVMGSTIIGAIVKAVVDHFRKPDIVDPELEKKIKDAVAQIPTKTAATVAAVKSATPTAAPTANSPTSEFQSATDAITEAARNIGINSGYLLGLAKLETQSGNKTVRGGGIDTKNLFNIKAVGDQPGIAAFDKTEGSNDKYRVFATYKDSVDALVDLLARKYPAALKANSPEEFAKALKSGGYATDSAYVSKLVSVIQANAPSYSASETRISRDMNNASSAETALFDKLPFGLGKIAQSVIPKSVKDALVATFGGSPTDTPAATAAVDIFGKTLDDAINKINSVFGTSYSADTLKGIGKEQVQTIRDAIDSFESAARNVGSATGIDKETLGSVIKQAKASVDSILNKPAPIESTSFRDLLKAKDTAEGLQLFNDALSKIGVTIDKATLDGLDANQYENLVNTLDQINKVTAAISDYQGIAKDRVLKDLEASKEYVKKILAIASPGASSEAPKLSENAVKAGEAFSTQFQSAVNTSLSDTLKGKISFRSFLDGLVDNFTSNVVSSFTTGFTNVIFKSLKLDEFFANTMAKIFSFGEGSASELIKSNPLNLAAISFQAAVSQFQLAVSALTGGSLFGSSGSLLSGFNFGDMNPNASDGSVLTGGLLGTPDLVSQFAEGASIANTSIVSSLNSGFTGVGKDFGAFGNSISGAISGIGSLFSSIGGGIGDVVSGIGNFFSGLLSFDSGGVIPGGFGQPVPIIAHGGEVFLNPRQQQQAILGGNSAVASGGISSNFNINVTGDIATQTRKEIQMMIPEIASGVNAVNRENNYKG